MGAQGSKTIVIPLELTSQINLTKPLSVNKYTRIQKAVNKIAISDSDKQKITNFIPVGTGTTTKRGDLAALTDVTITQPPGTPSGSTTRSYRIPPNSSIGAGSFGRVFSLGDGRVIKFMTTGGHTDDAKFLNETFMQLILYNDMQSYQGGTHALIPRIYDIFQVDLTTAKYNAIVTEQLDNTLLETIYGAPYHLQYSWLAGHPVDAPIEIRDGEYDLSTDEGLTDLISQLAPGVRARRTYGGLVAMTTEDPSVNIEDLIRIDFSSSIARKLGFEKDKMTIASREMFGFHPVQTKKLVIAKSNDLTPLKRSTYAAFAMYQIGKTLEFLYELRKYNHDDLKCDNIMIKWEQPERRNSNNIRFPQFYFIDFGFSRLEYNGFVFSGRYPTTDAVVPSQDLLFFTTDLFSTGKCDTYFVDAHKGNCKTIFDPQLTDALGSLLHDLDETIYDRFMHKKYIDDWRSMYVDAHLSHGHAMFSRLVDIAKTYLQSVARNGATEPMYFGRRSHRRRK
jgi:serine/threonine protein kinase